VSSVPAGGSISYSATGGSITSSPDNFAGATPTLIASGSTAAAASNTTTNDIVSSVTQVTESLAGETTLAPEAPPPAPAETSGNTFQLASNAQTTGGETGSFGAPEPTVGAGTTASGPAPDAPPAAESRSAEQAPAKAEDKTEAGKEKDEKKEDRPREDKKQERGAAVKKAAQCS